MLLCYWFVTTIYSYFFPATPALKGVASNGLQALEQHAIYGVILVLLGAGMASLGGRTAFTRRVMSRLVMTPKPAPLPALVKRGFRMVPRVCCKLSAKRR